MTFVKLPCLSTLSVFTGGVIVTSRMRARSKTLLVIATVAVAALMPVFMLALPLHVLVNVLPGGVNRHVRVNRQLHHNRVGGWETPQTAPRDHVELFATSEAHLRRVLWFREAPHDCT